jgi:hypothetical protein
MRCTDSATGNPSDLDWIPIMSKHFFRIAALAAMATAAGTALAQDTQEHRLGQHPAVLVQRQAAHIDPNTFIVGHPAGLAWVATPSITYDHPAVIVARMARQEREAAQTALVARSEAGMAQ